MVRCGSIFWMALQGGAAPRRADALSSEAPRIYRDLFGGLLGRGVYLAPSAFEVGFVSLAHRPEDLELLARALGAAFHEMTPR
jgi:glutamate-1-semialdehyde 2,1-aminomutase